MFTERQLDRVFALALVTLALFLGKIALSGASHSEYKEKFKAKCEAKGGVVFMPKGVKGWPVPECRNPNFTIKIDL